MLNKMRWRFIGAAMLAFFAVMVTLLCFIHVWNYREIAVQQDETLQRLMEVDRVAASIPEGVLVPPFESMERFSPEVPYMIRFFSVHYDGRGKIVRVNRNYIASVSLSDAKTYANAVLEKGKDRGYYNGYRYAVSQNEQGSTVLFLNSERELQAAKSLLAITAAISSGCLAVVFLLVLLFSGRAIAPYVRNLENQKQFITNASHELKTPLTAISTSADVLALEQGENEWIQNIQTQSGKLSRLITNLVTLSRLNEENPFPVRTTFSLSDALWEIGETFASVAKGKGKRYVQQIEDGLTLTGDRTAIGQMVSILLDNALKYSPEDGEILLLAERCGKHTQIAVKNRCARACPDVTRLFERFYRADESHSNTVSGTGIGLSIAKATAQAHGGTILARQENNCITVRVRF